MTDTAKRRTRATVESVPDPEPEGAAATGSSGGTAAAGSAAHEPATCPVAWCPVCLAVTAVQPVKPEVVEHLLKAGTEFFLALRSLIDARAETLGDHDRADEGPDAGFEKIDIG